MSTLDVRSRRVSRRQLELLCEYLNSHNELAVAYNRSLQAKEYSKEKWKELAEILNSQGDGCHKDWRGWSKYWVDHKAKLKAKVANTRASLSRTGGGPASEPLLTDLDKRFLQILGEDFGQGLQGVRVEPFSEEIPDLYQQVEVPVYSTQHSPLLGPPQTPSPPSQPTQVADMEHSAIPMTDTEGSPQPTPVADTESLPQPTAVAGPERTPGRRRRRREPAMSQEAARRALVRSSQQRADAATRTASALERIAQGIENGLRVLESIDRAMNAASFPRAAE